MICGGDYHGGNNQNGCGTSFHWSTAAKYVSSIFSLLTIHYLYDLPRLKLID